MRMYFIITLLLCFSYSYSQNDSLTLVKYTEVKYHSELEKQAFSLYFEKDSIDYIQLFLSKDKDITIDDFKIKKEYLLKYLESLRNEKVNSKSNKKKIKYFYKKIHDKYLVKYELTTYFSDIFKNGYYNCVTGSTLFSLVFEELGIPYTIKVSPIHAYLVAYPNSESILVETTNPVKGYFSFNDKFKQEYVKHLKDSKMISAQEYNSATINELFEKNYFKEKDISLKELVGIQYYNNAVEYLKEQSFENAFYELEKAYLFYPTKDIGYMLFYSCAMVIEQHNFTKKEDVDFLYKIARFKDYGISNEHIIGEFGTITQNQLDYRGNYALYDSLYFRLYNGLDDDSLKKEISFIYNYEKARLYMRNSKNNKALSYIEEAFLLRPDHLDIQTLFVNCIIEKFVYQRMTEEALNEMIEYTNKFSSIKKHKTYRNILIETYLFLANEAYTTGDIKKALKYHGLFKEYCTDKREYENYDNNVSILYSSASVYYFRKGNYKKAKAMIKEGLSLVPNSYELKQRLKAF